VPKVHKTAGNEKMAVRLTVGAVALLVVLVIVLLQSGLFDSQPSSPEERNLLLLTEALKKDPDNSSILLDLAENEYALGKKRDAVEHSTRAAEVATATPMVNLRHAQILLLTKDYEGAEKHLQLELDLPGTDTETPARFILAQVYREQGRLDEALALMERALRRDKQSADYRKLYADMLVTAGQTDEAIVQYKEVLRYLPDDEHSVTALKELGVSEIPTASADPHAGD
jgi:tetratricopeptide (TPR) repeat protein